MLNDWILYKTTSTCNNTYSLPYIKLNIVFFNLKIHSILQTNPNKIQLQNSTFLLSSTAIPISTKQYTFHHQFFLFPTPNIPAKYSFVFSKAKYTLHKPTYSISFYNYPNFTPFLNYAWLFTAYLYIFAILHYSFEILKWWRF